MFRSISRILVIITLGILAVFVFSIIRFPRDQAGRYVATVLEQRFPAAQCTVTPPELELPATLYLEQIRCTRSHGQKEVVVDDIRVTYTPVRSLTGFTARLRFGAGTVHGKIRLADKGRLVSIEHLQLSAIDLARTAPLLDAFHRSINGSLSFNGSLQLLSNNFEIVWAQGDLTMRKLNMELYKELFWNRKLLLDELRSKLSMTGPHLSLTQGQMQGPFFGGTFKVLVKNVRNWQNAQLEGRAAVNPVQSFLDGNAEARHQAQLIYRRLATPYFPVRISGTVHDPIIAISP